MKTIALRFSDNYAPTEGMLFHHKKIIDEYGFVWYGKFGNRISKEIIDEQLKRDDPKFLLIKSGTTERYWVHFNDFLQLENPELSAVPEYYRKDSDKVGCWFKITNFERADKDVMSRCFVLSSGDCLSTASKHSMNPYFKIEYRGEE